VLVKVVAWQRAIFSFKPGSEKRALHETLLVDLSVVLQQQQTPA